MCGASCIDKKSCSGGRKNHDQDTGISTLNKEGCPFVGLLDRTPKKPDTNFIADKYLESASVEYPMIRIPRHKLSSKILNQRRRTSD